MSKITLDASLRSKLNGLNEELEVCDESGATVGHYVPAELYRNMLYQIAEAQYPRTKEELAKLRQQTGGTTLAEFWKKMGRS
jgi:hypothetical protein